MKNQTKAKRK